ncbi:glycosyltransferase [Patescibacteria group bacterium]|nr:glycosyltransferase [Patescibacteria group bacterium]
MNKLSIIIPAKNEEKRIASTLSNYGSFFESRKPALETEIIVVVNDTDDSTPDIVDKYHQKYEFIRRVETHYASGKGGAVALGFNEATGDFIGYVDADGAVSASEIYRLYQFLEETPWLDGVVGVRSKDKTQMSLKRKVLSKVFNFWVRLLFNLNYSDTQCAAKIFRKDPAKDISKKLSKTGWAFDVNLLLVARYLNYRLLEQGVAWSEREGSKFSFYDAFINTPLELLDLKRMQLSYASERVLLKIWDFGVLDRVLDKAQNILIFAWRDIKHPEMGGSEVYVHQVAMRLAKKHNVTIFTSQPGNLSMIDEIDGVRIIRKGNRFTVYLWAFLIYVLYIGKKTDFIIDVQNGIPFFTALYSFKPKLMLLHHVHKKQWFKQFPVPVAIVGYFLEVFVMPFVYKHVPIITVSPSSKDELNSIGFADKRIFLGYNSIPPRVGGFYRESESPLLVYIGRVKAYKRLEIAVVTLRELIKEFPNLKLVIAGAGDYLDELKDLVSRLKLDDHVEFPGFVSERKKWELLQKAWVFLMPSMHEGWGITIIEAASCKTPAVGFNVLGVKDSIKHGVTGLLARDLEDYIESVRTLLNNKTIRKGLGENGEDWANKFSWQTTTKIFEEVIDAVSKGKKLMADKVYPWEVDLATETVTTLVNTK